MSADDESTLAILVPEAEPLVGAFRAAHDPSAAAGMPAHITVIYPFKHPDALDEGDVARLAAHFAAHAPIAFALAGVGQFDGVALYLAPEPAAPFVALIRAAVALYPDYPPYGGIHADLVPHLTVAQTADPAALRPGLASAAERLPLRATTREVALMERRGGRWRRHTAFPLGSG